MTDAGLPEPPETVSRRRYDRERRARAEAEAMLEARTRELFEANAALTAQAAALEREVAERTAEIVEAKLQAEQANEAKSAFLAMISHEIRTPLNGLLGMAQVLSETALTSEQAGLLGDVRESGDTLLALLNDMLDLSKIEARQLEIETIPVDIAALVQGQERLFAMRAREKGLDFDVRIDADARLRLRSDPTRLRQIVGNLLSNAVKFTEEGGVMLHLSRQGETMQLRVRDTGPGISEEQRQRLFQPFAQADASITRKFGGTGLGLAVSRELCRLLGGDLVHSDCPGGGAEFIASWQLEEVPAEEVMDAGGEVPDEFETVLLTQPWRILVAEDNLTNQRVLHLLLQRYELEMEFVTTGVDAVMTHTRRPAHLILMDVNMPEMDGLEAAAFIRQFEAARELPRVPIIALTANAMTHQVQEYLRQGVDAHVSKPVNRAQLGQVMARLLCEAHGDGAGEPYGCAKRRQAGAA